MLNRSKRFWRSASGFTVIEQMFTLGILVTVSAIAVPALMNTVNSQRLGIEARNVEREMQLARLSAVSTNRPIRVRFNCPSAGYYRRVELIGSVNNPDTGDDLDTQGARRCSLTYYPFPAADNDPLTRPNNDGPLQQLNSNVTFTNVSTLEFWPNGTVHIPNASPGPTPWQQVGSNPVNIVLSMGATSKLVAVNSLGKMQIQ